MTPLEIYLILAVSTGVWSCLELANPGLDLAKQNNNDISRFWAYVVILVIGSVLAPLFAAFILVPRLKLAFVEAFAGKH